jgi:hypothetical protein
MGAWRRKHQGIAILSFTNVAWKEIEETVLTETASGEFLKHPHFIGTIDSFLNQYVFLPHAQHVVGCKKRPELVGPPVNVWNAKGTDGSLGFQQFDNMAFQQDGSIELINKRKLAADTWIAQRDNMLRTKKSLIRAGYATQSDALYISWLLIKRYPTLARAVATRFPVVIVDEAQDTSRMQMEILDHLMDAGLERIMFVGDPDQSIYEWNRAEPSLLLEKYEAWQDGSLELTENWRSSQRICTFTSKLASLSAPATAVHPDYKDIEAEPYVVGYEDVTVLPALFEQQLNDTLGVGKWKSESVAILVRSNALTEEIIGETGSGKIDPWNGPHTERLCRARVLLTQKDVRNAFRVAELAIAGMILGKPNASRADVKSQQEVSGIIRWREIVSAILLALPSVDETLGNWLVGARQVVGRVLKDRAPNLTANGNASGLVVKSLFVKERLCVAGNGIPVRTIHSVKGMTLDAVMVVLRSRTPENKTYKKMLVDGVKVGDEEELRIVYVGLTRPQRFVCLAAPQADLAAWRGKFQLDDAVVAAPA